MVWLLNCTFNHTAYNKLNESKCPHIKDGKPVCLHSTKLSNNGTQFQYYSGGVVFLLVHRSDTYEFD